MASQSEMATNLVLYNFENHRKKNLFLKAIKDIKMKGN
jgi:hypothetical protein